MSADILSIGILSALQGHHAQQNGGVHDWLIQTPVSTVHLIIIHYKIVHEVHDRQTYSKNNKDGKRKH